MKLHPRTNIYVYRVMFFLLLFVPLSDYTLSIRRFLNQSINTELLTLAIRLKGKLFAVYSSYENKVSPQGLLHNTCQCHLHSPCRYRLLKDIRRSVIHENTRFSNMCSGLRKLQTWITTSKFGILLLL